MATGLGENLRNLAHDAVGSAKKRRHISKCLKGHGLISLGKGSWLGFRNRDIVSGLLIEGSPLDTYISTFLLPAFDRQKFVSWSLGERVVHCSIDKDSVDECEIALASYVKKFGSIQSAVNLIGYLDANDIKGGYPIWSRYICYLRVSNFEAAISYLDDEKIAQLHPVQLGKYDEIRAFVAARDESGIRQVFGAWSEASQEIFGPLDQAFSAFG
ncbi:hypothetical protein [Sphingomonas sp. IC081]|uniref:hypothetical protein n=1 Tax=Sphingomonas sp. IC081 TaxID=304378 RepID=UPI0011626E37|nr:hypothetical protein [Sphingomonas sp. IC081]QDK36030.1 hypothetical protein DM450_0170 [Sphingomonas sp. IC081]